MRGWWLVLALVGAVALGYVGRAQLDGKRAAADQATIRGHEATIAALNTQIGRKDTVFRIQRDTFLIRRQRWDTVKTVDTVTVRQVSIDTLRLVVRVADSTIAACSLALTTCEERTALLRERIAVDSGTIRALSREVARARIRSRLACAAGPTVTPKGVTLGASCGVRLF